MSTKTFQNFFLSHKPKHLPKLALPIKNNNNQKIAYWYKPTYNENKKKTQKVLAGGKHRHQWKTNLEETRGEEFCQSVSL